jgi:hypothetical protein
MSGDEWVAKARGALLRGEIAALAVAGRLGVGPFARPGNGLWYRLWWTVWIVVVLRGLSSPAAAAAGP